MSLNQRKRRDLGHARNVAKDVVSAIKSNGKALELLPKMLSFQPA